VSANVVKIDALKLQWTAGNVAFAKNIYSVKCMHGWDAHP
jgi:hypothetical protein